MTIDLDKFNKCMDFLKSGTTPSALPVVPPNSPVEPSHGTTSSGTCQAGAAQNTSLSSEYAVPRLRRANAVRYSAARLTIYGGRRVLRETTEARRSITDTGNLYPSADETAQLPALTQELSSLQVSSTTPPGSPSAFARSLVPREWGDEAIQSKDREDRSAVGRELNYFDIHAREWVDIEDIQPEDEIIRQNELIRATYPGCPGIVQEGDNNSAVVFDYNHGNGSRTYQLHSQNDAGPANWSNSLDLRVGLALSRGPEPVHHTQQETLPLPDRNLQLGQNFDAEHEHGVIWRSGRWRQRERWEAPRDASAGPSSPRHQVLQQTVWDGRRTPAYPSWNPYPIQVNYSYPVELPPDEAVMRRVLPPWYENPLLALNVQFVEDDESFSRRLREWLSRLETPGVGGYHL